MATYIILSRIGHEAFMKDFKKIAAEVSGRIRKECPGVHWHGSYATLGQYDVVDIVEAESPDDIARVAAIIRGSGYTRTETMPATPWKEFLAKL